MLSRTLVNSIENLVMLISSKKGEERSLLANKLRAASLKTRESLLSRGDLFVAAESPIASSSITILVRSFERERHLPTLTRVVESLGDIGNGLAVEFLSLMITAKDELVAVAAAASLGEIGGLRATERLVATAHSRSGCDRGLAAINALEALAVKTGLSYVENDDDLNGLRKQVAASLMETAEDARVDQVIRSKAKNVVELAGMEVIAPSLTYAAASPAYS